MRYAILCVVACTFVAASPAEYHEPAGTVLERELEAIDKGLRSGERLYKLEALRYARLLELFPLSVTLADALGDPDEKVRYAAIDALYEMGPAAYLKTDRILERLKDDSNRVRERAAGTLSAIGPLARQAVPDLVKALDDEDERVRLRALVALGNIGGRRSRPSHGSRGSCPPKTKTSWTPPKCASPGSRRINGKGGRTHALRGSGRRRLGAHGLPGRQGA